MNKACLLLISTIFVCLSVNVVADTPPQDGKVVTGYLPYNISVSGNYDAGVHGTHIVYGVAQQLTTGQMQSVATCPDGFVVREGRGMYQVFSTDGGYCASRVLSCSVGQKQCVITTPIQADMRCTNQNASSAEMIVSLQAVCSPIDSNFRLQVLLAKARGEIE